MTNDEKVAYNDMVRRFHKGCDYMDNPDVAEETKKKCLMSLQVDATIMGEDMGTPKLRNGVVCLGKMVGYDSDDETEWQGFD